MIAGLIAPVAGQQMACRGASLGSIPSRWMLVFTDAYLTGLGAVWEGHMVRGPWDPPWDTNMVFGHIRTTSIIKKTQGPSTVSR